ncbi:MAG: hypothetical protein HW387_801 [Parachlamydiales bacterium]|nr:hypothetical protein [Parachlamydiales bacterium]
MATAEKIDFIPYYLSAPAPDVVLKTLRGSDTARPEDSHAAPTSRMRAKITSSAPSLRASGSTGQDGAIDALIKTFRKIIKQETDPDLKAKLTQALDALKAFEADPSSASNGIQTLLASIGQAIDQEFAAYQSDPSMQALFTQAKESVANAQAAAKNLSSRDPNDKASENYFTAILQMISALLNLQITVTQVQANKMSNFSAISNVALTVTTADGKKAVDKMQEYDDKQAQIARDNKIDKWLSFGLSAVFTLCSIFIGPAAFIIALALMSVTTTVFYPDSNESLLGNGIHLFAPNPSPAVTFWTSLGVCVIATAMGIGLAWGLDSAIAKATTSAIVAGVGEGCESAGQSVITNLADMSASVGDEVEMTAMDDVSRVAISGVEEGGVEEGTEMIETEASRLTNFCKNSLSEIDDDSIAPTASATSSGAAAGSETVGASAKAAARQGMKADLIRSETCSSWKATAYHAFVQSALMTNLPMEGVTALIEIKAIPGDEDTKKKWEMALGIIITIILVFLATKFISPPQGNAGMVIANNVSNLAKTSKAFGALNLLYRLASSTLVKTLLTSALTIGSSVCKILRGKATWDTGTIYKELGPIQAELQVMQQTLNSTTRWIKSSTDSAKAEMKGLSEGNARWIELTQPFEVAARV